MGRSPNSAMPRPAACERSACHCASKRHCNRAVASMRDACVFAAVARAAGSRSRSAVGQSHQGDLQLPGKRFEQRVILEPVARSGSPVSIVRSSARIRHAWIHEAPVAGAVRSRPVGRAVPAGGHQWQHLPHREPGIGEPVDEADGRCAQRAFAIPKQCRQRQEHAGTPARENSHCLAHARRITPPPSGVPCPMLIGCASSGGGARSSARYRLVSWCRYNSSKSRTAPDGL